KPGAAPQNSKKREKPSAESAIHFGHWDQERGARLNRAFSAFVHAWIEFPGLRPRLGLNVAPLALNSYGFARRVDTETGETTLAFGRRRIDCQVSAFLNHGHKTKIHRSKTKPALKDKIDTEGAHDGSRKKKENAAVCLLFRGRARRRVGHHETAPRRQRGKPPRDDAHRFACATGIHNHYRSLQLFLRSQMQLSAAVGSAGGGCAGKG